MEELNKIGEEKLKQMPNEGHIKILWFFPILINAKKPQQMKNIIRLDFTVRIQQ